LILSKRPGISTEGELSLHFIDATVTLFLSLKIVYPGLFEESTRNIGRESGLRTRQLRILGWNEENSKTRGDSSVGNEE
jgi:hypothetical protein